MKVWLWESGSSPRLLPSPRPGLRLFGLGRFVSFLSIHWAFFPIPTPCCKKEPSFGSLGGVWTSDSPSLARGAITIAGSVCLSEGPSFARWVSSFVSSKVTFSSLSTILLGHIRDRCPWSWQIMHPKGTAPFHSPGY